MSTSLKLTCFLIPLYLLWGMNWVIMKVANGYFPPVLFATLRFACGSAIMLLVLLINRPHLPARRLWPWIFAAGALQIAYNKEHGIEPQTIRKAVNEILDKMR